MRVKFIEKNNNKAGTTYGLALLKNGSFGVFVLKKNYASHIKGGISSSWACYIKNVDEQTARNLFDKKLKGKAKH